MRPQDVPGKAGIIRSDADVAAGLAALLRADPRHCLRALAQGRRWRAERWLPHSPARRTDLRRRLRRRCRAGQ